MIHRFRYARCAAAALLALSLAGPMTVPNAYAQAATYQFDLPAQSLATALRAIGRQTGKNILFDPAVVEGLTAPALRAELTLNEAIQQLLHGTRLRVESAADDTLLLQRVSNGGAGDGEQSADSTRDAASGLEEIIVTATKRAVSIQDVPSSISALSSEAIERRSLVGMGDYLNTVPGVSVNDMGAGRNSVVIRGIGISEADRDVTGIYFGEVPLTSLAYYGNADVKLVDMSRVEVLRGPQGTLYGAGAMGGAVRSIPAPPDPLDFHARVSATYSRTAELGGDNSSLEGMVNIPLLDGTLAVRAVGYKFRNSGFYQNLAASNPAVSQLARDFWVPQLAVDKHDVGNDEYAGGRLNVLWVPTDRLRATLTYLNQDLQQEGFPEVQLGLGDGMWTQARLQAPALKFKDVSSRGGADYLGDELEATNLVIEYDLGWASLVSSTSWVEEFSVRNLDNTALFGFPAFHVQGNKTDALFQELRLSSQLEGPVQFIAGVFYENLDKAHDVANRYSGAAGLNPYGDEILADLMQLTKREQKALFGEITYSITDTLAATVGARVFEYTVTDGFDTTGAFIGTEQYKIKAKQSQDSYKFNLTYKPSADSLMYAQFAQGFRLGYPNRPIVPPACDLDHDGFIDGSDVSTGLTQIKSDFLDSYELGGKFQLFDNRLSVQASIYQADWQGMPTTRGFECLAEVIQNLGEARSRGAELSVEWQFDKQLKAEFSASFTDAKIARTTVGLGNEGDRLPGSPRYSYNVGVQYDFSLQTLPSFIEWNLAYRGKLYSDFTQSGLSSGDYYLMNARWGVSVGKVNLAVFANNLTNEDGLVWVSQLFNDSRAYRLRPRTLGLELAYQF